MPSIFQMSGLDAAVLELQDRLHHQLRPQLGVVAVGVAADALELRRLGGHEQLEQVLAVMLVQPLGEAAQLLDLALVHRLVALRVVSDEHLREVGVVLLDLLAELRRRTRSRTRSGPTSRPASRACSRPPSPRARRPARTARRRGRPRTPSARRARPRAGSPPRSASSRRARGSNRRPSSRTTRDGRTRGCRAARRTPARPVRCSSVLPSRELCQLAQLVARFIRRTVPERSA